jgi:hypothetical protein
MRAAIMQPYFLPYLGYFQLMQLADVFVVYDNIQYTKKGWINRNRMLVNGQAALFTLPLKHASASLDIAQRELADDFPDQAGRILRRFEAAYATAPFFAETMMLLRECLHCPDRNLFRFLLHSLQRTATHLGITTPLVVSSSLAVDPALHAEDRVIATCQAIGATEYLNPPGGRDLYNQEQFSPHGITLRFLSPQIEPYQQFGTGFISHLSVIDALMFNAPALVSAIARSGRSVP